MKKFLLTTCIAILSLSTLVVPQVEAAVNAEINYQGRLVDNSNVAVANGTYNMRFNLYTTLTGGSSIWTETLTTTNRVPVTSGLFSVMLGSTTPFTGVDFNQTLYLGVEIGGTSVTPSWDGEMSPRKIIGVVPAALTADTLDSLDSTQFLRSDTDGTLTGSLTVSGTLTSGTINSQTISSAANFTGTVTATGGLTTLSNLLLTGSSTFQNLTFANATGTNATTTSLAATTICFTNDTCRTTWPTGGSGTFPFDVETWGVSTTTPIGLFGGFISNASSTINANLLVNGNSTTSDATTTNFFATNITSTNFYGAGLSSCNNLTSALTWSAGLFGCNTINGSGGGTDVNWSFFNNSGIRLGTSTNQVLVSSSGATATTSLAKLEVAFDSAANGSFLVTGSSTLQNFTFRNATGTSATTTNFYATTASSTDLYSSTLAVGGSSLVVNSSGTVGIGTSSPFAKLAVQGTTGQTNPLFQIASSSVSTQFVTVQSNGTTTFYSDSYLGDQTFTISRNGDTDLRVITSSGGDEIRTVPIFAGNFDSSQSTYYTAVEHSPGISFSAPVSSLITGADTAGAFAGMVTGCNASIDCYGLLNIGEAAGIGALSKGNVIPGIGFAGLTQTDNRGTRTVLGASILGIVDGTVSASKLPTSLVFNTSATSDSGLAERLRITSAGTIGIGTTTPQWLLQLASSTASQLTLSDAIATDNHWSFRNAGGILYIATSSPSTFATSSTAALTITANGRVIANCFSTDGASCLTSGSQTPWTQDINGGGFSLTNVLGIEATRSTTTQATTTNFFATTASTTNLFASTLQVDGSTIFVGSSHRVGIGTAVPGYKLDVNGDINFAADKSIYQGGTRVLDASSTNSSTVLGLQAGGANSATGFFNTLIGYQAGITQTTAQHNSFLGYSAGLNNTGSNNTFLGSQAGFTNTTGDKNVFVGYNAGETSVTGTNNALIGYQAGFNNSSATSSVALGYDAALGGAAYAAQNFTAIGNEALAAVLTGADDNTALGYRAGFAVTTGSKNILLGNQAGVNLQTGSSNIIIGYNVNSNAINSSNTLNIGNAIFGRGIDGTGSTLSNANIGIGTSTPNWSLQIASTTPYLAITDTDAGTNAKHILLSNNDGVFKIGTSSDDLSSTSTALSLDPGLTSPSFGIGTTSPWGKVAINPIAGDGNSFVIGSSSATSFVISDAGRVGIGTSTPGALFSVQGAGLFQGDVMVQGNATSSAFYVSGNASTTHLFGTDINGFGLASCTGANALQWSGGTFGCAAVGSGTVNSGTTNRLAYYTGSTAVSSSGFLTALDAGNYFGIGTTTPQWLLQLASSTAPQLTLSDAIAGDNHWSFRNAGGVLYIATSSPTTFATSTVTALSIDTNGSLAVANLVSCGGVQTNANGVMSCTSDANLKNIQGPFTEGLSALVKITPQTYSWKSGTPLYDGGVPYSGFIAQDVQQAIPEAVNHGQFGLQISQLTILATAVNAIKELNAKMDALSLTSASSSALTTDAFSAALSQVVASGIEFTGRPVFNSDTGGLAVVHEGDRQVDVIFDQPYVETPVVSATISLDASTTDADLGNILDSNPTYAVAHRSTNGFSIILSKPAVKETTFSWVALAIKNPKTADSQGVKQPVFNYVNIIPPTTPTPAPAPTGSTTPAGAGSSTPPTTIGSTTPTTSLTNTASSTASTTLADNL